MAGAHHDGAAVMESIESWHGDSITRQRGVVLGIVVWFIAGMALLVSGIIAEARVDTRMAQLHYFRAQAAAAGDGAINMALAEQEGRRSSGQRVANRLQNYQIGQRSVEVRMIPGGVFVNISSEDEEGLRALFRLGAVEARDYGHVWGESPASLAAAVIEFRDGLGGRGGKLFHSPEDLLRVPGVSRGVYDAVRNYITVGDLADGFQSNAETVESRLEHLRFAVAGEGVVTQGAAQHAAKSLRIDAIVNIGEKKWLRRRWATLEDSGFSLLPWRYVRTEAARPLSMRDPSGGQ